MHTSSMHDEYMSESQEQTAKYRQRKFDMGRDVEARLGYGTGFADIQEPVDVCNSISAKLGIPAPCQFPGGSTTAKFFVCKRTYTECKTAKKAWQKVADNAGTGRREEGVRRKPVLPLVLQFPSFPVSQFLNFAQSTSPSFPVSLFPPSPSVSQFPSFPISHNPSFAVSQFPSFSTSRSPRLPVSQFPCFQVSHGPSFTDCKRVLVAQTAKKNKGKQATAFVQELRDRPDLCRFGLGVQTLSKRQLAVGQVCAPLSVCSSVQPCALPCPGPHQCVQVTKTPIAKEMDALVHGEAGDVKAANSEQLSRALQLAAVEFGREQLDGQEHEVLQGRQSHSLLGHSQLGQSRLRRSLLALLGQSQLCHTMLA